MNFMRNLREGLSRIVKGSDEKRKEAIYAQGFDSPSRRASIDAAYDMAKSLDMSGDIKAAKTNPEAAGYVYFEVARNVHDAWCMRNDESFRDKSREDRRFQFLSSEAIGWEEFKKDMEFASAALESFGVPPFRHVEVSVKQFYESRREDYLAQSYGDIADSERDRWAALSNANHFDVTLPSVEEYRTFEPHKILGWCGVTGVSDKGMVGEPYYVNDAEGSISLEDSNAVHMCLGSVGIDSEGKVLPPKHLDRSASIDEIAHSTGTQHDDTQVSL